MATIHIPCVGNKALFSQSALDRFVELTQWSEAITVLRQEDDVSTLGLMRLMEQGGGFDFWKEEGKTFTWQRTVNHMMPPPSLVVTLS
jgi:hypothetical protein